MVLAMSVQWGEERPSAGTVVKPTWLLMMTWIVPPVLKPAQVAGSQHKAGIPSSACIHFSYSTSSGVHTDVQNQHDVVLVDNGIVQYRTASP